MHGILVMSPFDDEITIYATRSTTAICNSQLSAQVRGRLLWTLDVDRVRPHSANDRLLCSGSRDPLFDETHTHSDLIITSNCDLVPKAPPCLILMGPI